MFYKYINIAQVGNARGGGVEQEQNLHKFDTCKHYIKFEKRKKLLGFCNEAKTINIS